MPDILHRLEIRSSPDQAPSEGPGKGRPFPEDVGIGRIQGQTEKVRRPSPWRKSSIRSSSKLKPPRSFPWSRRAAGLSNGGRRTSPRHLSLSPKARPTELS